MEYSEQTVILIKKVIEDLRNNLMENCKLFSQNYILNKGLNSLDKKGVIL